MTGNQPFETKAPDAVVWVDERHAILARTSDDGISTIEIRRAARSELRYLADVVHEIGDRQRVMVIGPTEARLALEREFVAIGHRPDRLVAAPAGTREAGPQILDRIERLAA